MAASKNLSNSLSSGSAEVVDFPCSICQAREKKEVESSHYCVDCDANMCAACTQPHAFYPAMASHQVVDISKAPGTHAQKPKLPTQRCDKHHGKIIDHYCLDDDTVACETCVNIIHRNCKHMKYIPQISKGTSKGKSSQNIKKSTGETITKLKKMKSSKEDTVKRLDKAEAKTCQEVQDLRTRLHKYVDNLADGEDAKIKSEFQKKKGEVQKDIAAIDDQIDAAETISKKLNNFHGDNDSELFVCIKQGEEVERDAKMKLKTLSEPELPIPTYKINNTVEKSLRETKSLGQFEKKAIKIAKEKIRVRHAKDAAKCNITGICLLPDASVIIVDSYNSSLKKLDPSYKLVGYLDMSAKPFDVCYTVKNEVAVTMPSKVQFVDVGSAIKMTRSFEEDINCKGIACSNDTLFVCSGSEGSLTKGKVCMYSLSGRHLGTISNDTTEKSLFTMPLYITVTSCASKLLVTDVNKRIVITDKATRKLLDTFKDTELLQAQGICIMDNGDWLVADIFANKVLHVSRDGRMLGVVLKEQNGIVKPQAVCYDSAYSRLLVSSEACDIMQVYQIP